MQEHICCYLNKYIVYTILIEKDTKKVKYMNKETTQNLMLSLFLIFELRPVGIICFKLQIQTFVSPSM